MRLSHLGVQVLTPHIVLDVTYEDLRRIQLDVEQDRPATFVIVLHDPNHPPQVVDIAPEQYGAAGDAIAIIGGRLAQVSTQRQHLRERQ